MVGCSVLSGTMLRLPICTNPLYHSGVHGQLSFANRRGSRSTEKRSTFFLQKHCSMFCSSLKICFSVRVEMERGPEGEGVHGKSCGATQVCVEASEIPLPLTPPWFSEAFVV